MENILYILLDILLVLLIIIIIWFIFIFIILGTKFVKRIKRILSNIEEISEKLVEEQKFIEELFHHYKERVSGIGSAVENIEKIVKLGKEVSGYFKKSKRDE